jgi:Family of unknown function (DUF5681)
VSKKSRVRPSPNPGWFAKGRSGNLRGRPKTSRVSNGSAFEVLEDKTLAVADRGGTREITIEEALQRRTFQEALAGKSMAMREVVKWIIKREAWLAKQEPKPRQQILWVSNPDPDNADAALVLLGVAAPHPVHAKSGRTALLLEPWAVQAALRRRRGGQRLSEEEIEKVRRCTRDPDSLRWPRRTGR